MNHFFPSQAEVGAAREQGTQIPVYTLIPADMVTPVSIFFRLCRDDTTRSMNGSQLAAPSFLLESAEAGTRFGRYTFLGLNTERTLVAYGDEITESTAAGTVQQIKAKPFDYLRSLLDEITPVVVPELPKFCGGAVGMFGYDMVRFIEELPATAGMEIGTPDMVMLFSSEMVVFDHVKHSLMVIVNLDLTAEDLAAEYARVCTRITEISAQIHTPCEEPILPEIKDKSPWTCSHTREEYRDIVLATKEYINAGDIFQGVLSMRQKRNTNADPFTIYRALRIINPSSYMFYFDFSQVPGIKGQPLRVVGSSPEMHVRLEDREASLHPIAGSRWRGSTPEEDDQLAEDLLRDPKERAEHVMLVDLGRNDLGRVCEYGSVRIQNVMEIERYSHIMHIVSDVRGHLQADYDAIDLLRATMPAGTLSGAPKIRAMEIIEELEGERRGPYGGVIGYLDYGGSMDTCIAIRTITMQGKTCILQAGGGLVADSEPDYEYQEAMNKMRALTVAVKMAEDGLQV